MEIRIEEDIKRCKKLAEPQNANWIGISNQLAIAHLIERMKELEEINTANRKVIVEQCDYIQNKSIPKQKVKDVIKNETINISGFECIAVENLGELLEEK